MPKDYIDQTEEQIVIAERRIERTGRLFYNMFYNFFYFIADKIAYLYEKFSQDEEKERRRRLREPF